MARFRRGPAPGLAGRLGSRFAACILAGECGGDRSSGRGIGARDETKRVLSLTAILAVVASAAAVAEPVPRHAGRPLPDVRRVRRRVPGYP